MRRIGRRGEGPGEFVRPIALGWKADTLWVGDPSLRRISLFQQDGAFVRSVRGSAPMAALLADGSLLTLSAPQWDGPRYLLRDPPGGRERDTLTHLGAASTARIPVGAGAIVAPQPFGNRGFWHVSSDGTAVYVVRNSTGESGEHGFHIARFAPTGELVYARDYNYDPLPLTDRVFDMVVSDFLTGIEGFRRGGVNPPPVDERVIRKALARPRFLPPVTRVLPSRDGSLWIRREEGEAASTKWDVIGQDGEVTGSVSLPRDLDVRRIEGRRLWVVLFGAVRNKQPNPSSPNC